MWSRYAASMATIMWSWFTRHKPEGDESRIAVLDVRQAENNSQVLRLLVNAIEVVSFRELIPRMEDIFIKLVTNNNQ